MSLSGRIVKELWIVECRREHPYDISTDGKVVNEWEVMLGHTFENIDRQCEWEIKNAYEISKNLNPILEHRFIKFTRGE